MLTPFRGLHGQSCRELRNRVTSTPIFLNVGHTLSEVVDQKCRSGLEVNTEIGLRVSRLHKEWQQQYARLSPDGLPCGVGAQFVLKIVH
jgi:hypothetical protein